jgi:hypothetical protein
VGRTPQISNVIPSDDGDLITIQGSGFESDAVAVIGLRGVFIPLDTIFDSSVQLTAALPDNLEPGTYALFVVNGRFSSHATVAASQARSQSKRTAAGLGGGKSGGGGEVKEEICKSLPFEFTLGAKGPQGVRGPDGEDGKDGKDGEDGEDGECPVCDDDDCKCKDEDDCQCEDIDDCACPNPGVDSCFCLEEDCTCDVTQLCTQFVSSAKTAGGTPTTPDCAPISGPADPSAVSTANCFRSRMVVTETCDAQNFLICFQHPAAGGTERFDFYLDIAPLPNDPPTVVAGSSEFICTSPAITTGNAEVCCEDAGPIRIPEGTYPVFVNDLIAGAGNTQIYYSFECCPVEEP